MQETLGHPILVAIENLQHLAFKPHSIERLIDAPAFGHEGKEWGSAGLIVWAPWATGIDVSTPELGQRDSPEPTHHLEAIRDSLATVVPPPDRTIQTVPHSDSDATIGQVVALDDSLAPLRSSKGQDRP